MRAGAAACGRGASRPSRRGPDATGRAFWQNEPIGRKLNDYSTLRAKPRRSDGDARRYRADQDPSGREFPGRVLAYRAASTARPSCASTALRARPTMSPIIRRCRSRTSSRCSISSKRPCSARTISRPLRSRCAARSPKRGLTPRHAQDLLTAFRMDVTKRRYRDWDDLMHYCSYSAMPVGRFVLDVHGEYRSTWPANDALCAALQVINHMQDCRADYQRLDRVYVPLDAMARAGTSVEALAADRASPELRRCLGEVMEQNRRAGARGRAVLRRDQGSAPRARGRGDPEHRPHADRTSCAAAIR